MHGGRGDHYRVEDNGEAREGPILGEDTAAVEASRRDGTHAPLRRTASLLEAASALPPVTSLLTEVAATPIAASGMSGMSRATILLFDHRGDLVAGTSRTADGAFDGSWWRAVRERRHETPAISAARSAATSTSVATKPDEVRVEDGPAGRGTRFLVSLPAGPTG